MILLNIDIAATDDDTITGGKAQQLAPCYCVPAVSPGQPQTLAYLMHIHCQAVGIPTFLPGGGWHGTLQMQQQLCRWRHFSLLFLYCRSRTRLCRARRGPQHRFRRQHAHHACCPGRGRSHQYFAAGAVDAVLVVSNPNSSLHGVPRTWAHRSAIKEETNSKTWQLFCSRPARVEITFVKLPSS